MEEVQAPKLEAAELIELDINIRARLSRSKPKYFIGKELAMFNNMLVGKLYVAISITCFL